MKLILSKKQKRYLLVICPIIMIGSVSVLHFTVWFPKYAAVILVSLSIICIFLYWGMLKIAKEKGVMH